MYFPDAEIIHTASHKWVLLISGREPENYKTQGAAKARLRWLRKWKAEQQEA